LNVDSVRDNLTKPVNLIISQERTIRKDIRDMVSGLLLFRYPAVYCWNSRRNTVRDRLLGRDSFQIASISTLQTILIPLVSGAFYEEVPLTPGATFEFPFGHLFHLSPLYLTYFREHSPGKTKLVYRIIVTETLTHSRKS
jgi:hypothetical protein